MSFGWSGQILRVDLSNRKSSTEPTEPYTQPFIGGRGISVKIMYDEVGPEISPFDPGNRLLFGAGVLGGTPAPASSRTKVTSMSPFGLLTSAGLGGFIGAEIKHAGYDNIIIEGKSDKPVYLYIHNDSVEFKDATHLRGKNTWETQQIIKEEIGGSAQIMCIGPGGENLVSFGCILTGRGSAAARGGLGAIMGSKNLKAIAVRGTRGIKIAKLEEFMIACEQVTKMFSGSGFTEGRWPWPVRGGYTYAQGFDYFRHVGTFTLGNWEEDTNWDEEIGRFSGGNELANQYGISWVQCFGCPVGHTCICDVPGIGIGHFDCKGAVVFYGPAWNNDRKVAFHANYLCNSYGLDVISVGNIISFLMELYHRGIITEKDTDGIAMRRGDKNAIISTIHKIGKQEGFGKLFRNGVLQAARTIGQGAEDCAMQVKGLEIYQTGIPTYKSKGLSAAVAPGGAEILEGAFIDAHWAEANRAEANSAQTKEKWVKLAEERYGSKEAAFPTSYEKKAASVWDQANRCCVADMLGVCKYFFPWMLTPSFEIPAKLFSLATGRDTTEDELLSAAQRTRTLERAFNVIKGGRRKDDTLPKRLFEITVPGGMFKGEKLERQKFDKMVDEYYQLRGWDEDGIPTEETFKKFELSSEWEVFKKRLEKGVIFHV